MCNILIEKNILIIIIIIINDICYTLHTKLLELNEVLLILGVFIPSFFAIIWQLNRINPGKNRPKKGVDAADSSVSELFAVQTEQIKEIVKSKTNQIKSLQRQLDQNQGVTDQETTEKGATFEEITELVKASYPQYLTLLPLFKGQIMKATGGMSINEIIQYIATLTGKTQGSGFPPVGTTQNPQNQPVDWA